MSDLDQNTLHDIAQTRARYFTPTWFADLLGGRLAAGDTFWIGNLGIELFVVPAVVLATLLVKIGNPAAVAPMLGAVFALIGIYRLALLRGLWISARAAPMYGWHWAGLIATLGFALGELGFAATSLL